MPDEVPASAPDKQKRKYGRGGCKPGEPTYPGCDIEGEELDFIKAVDAYRVANRRKFLMMTEVLKVAKSLGYRRQPIHAPADTMPESDTTVPGDDMSQTTEAASPAAELPACTKARGKFKLIEIRDIGGYTKDYIFQTQYDSNLKEDVSFSKATPSGRIEMRIDNPHVAAMFKMNGYYYFDAIPVPVPEVEVKATKAIG